MSPPAMNRPRAKSRVSPGRNGKNSPHSMKTMTRLSQIRLEPNSARSQSGSIHLMPNNIGVRCGDARSAVTYKRYLPGPHAVGPIP